MSELSPIDWALHPLKRYADFKGRAPRAEYWWFYLATLIVDRVLSFVDDKAWGEDGLLAAIFGLLILIPWIAVTIRRLHDTDRSGWWLMIVVAPATVFVAVAIQSAIAGGDGPTDNPILTYGSMIIAIVGGLAILIFMVMPGTEGPNRFGQDPYGPDQLEEIFA